MLTVISGPMFSGKTERLLAIINANLQAKNTVSVFKPSNDIRYELDKIVSHSGGSFGAIRLNKHRPDQLIYDVRFSLDLQSDVLIFDECQFFDSDYFIHLIRKLLGRKIICAGLPNDFQGWPFGSMPFLLASADEIISLKGVCAKCKTLYSSTRTFRKTKEKAQTIIGGAEIYESRCFECWQGVLDE